MSAAPTLELFVCVPQQGARLTRHACAKRHEASTGGPRKARNGGMELALLAYACEGCAIGAAHAKGQTPERWPDGSPIVVISTSTPAPTAKPTRAPLAPFLADVVPSEPRLDPPVHPPAGTDRGVTRRAAATTKRRVRPATTSAIGACIECGAAFTRLGNLKRCERCLAKKQAPKASTGRGRLGRPLTLNGRSLSIAAWARAPEVVALGITLASLYERLRRGWSDEEALTTPRCTAPSTPERTRAQEREKKSRWRAKRAARAGTSSYTEGCEPSASQALNKVMLSAGAGGDA